MHLTLIMAYYDNPTMLKLQLENIAACPPEIKERLELIVIDDCSPRWPAQLFSDPGVPTYIYRTKVDVPWNQDFCRNLGVYQAKTDWVLLTDIDHIVPEQTFYNILNICRLKSHIVYKFERVSAPELQPYKPHPNSWLINRDFYCNTLIGYDERFAGNYGTDGDFRDRINKFTNIEMLPLKIIRVGREVIPDASTTTLVRKKPEDGHNIQHIKRERGNADPLILNFPWERIYSPDIQKEELA